MSRTMETEVFTFAELDDSAKEKARDWYREGALQYDWWDSVYDDAAEIADKLGIELKQKSVPLMNGGTVQQPCIWFSGFCSQGDGACFEGDYRYRKGSVKDVMEHAPKDEGLHKIAKGLQDIQRRYFYGITVKVTHSGRYCHSRSVDFDVNLNERDYSIDTKDDHEAVCELLRDFMDWIYQSLETEYDYLMSDESVDEMIECTEYEFTEDGHRA